MADFGQLTEIYAQFEREMRQAMKGDTIFTDVLRTTEDPAKLRCSESFFHAVEQWTEAFLEEDPDTRQVAEAVEWILKYAHEHPEKNLHWYPYAAQREALKLIPKLEEEQAKVLWEKFRSWYPKNTWLPVQKELNAALQRQSGAMGKQENTVTLRQWAVRVVLLLGGLTIAHLGVTLFLLTNLGSDPFNVMIQGLTAVVPLEASHGTIHVAVSLAIIVVLLAVDRSYVRIGTLLCMVLGGPIIDGFTGLLKRVVNESSPMALRIPAVIAGCAILAFGMTVVIKSRAGTGPNDLVAVVISDKSGWKFGIVRIVVDLSFTAAGFALGGTVGVGTVICMAVVGPVAQVFMPFSEKICNHFLQE